MIPGVFAPTQSPRRFTDLVMSGQIFAPLTVTRAQVGGVQTAAEVFSEIILVAPNYLHPSVSFTRAQVGSVSLGEMP
jgi:hypothetical protein